MIFIFFILSRKQNELSYDKNNKYHRWQRMKISKLIYHFRPKRIASIFRIDNYQTFRKPKPEQLIPLMMIDFFILLSLVKL